MAADGGPAVGRVAAATCLAAAAATGAAATGASAARGSPSRAATSEAVKAGRLLRPRRACSAAIVDLLHFFPSATHLATSALMGPLGAGVEAAGAAGAGVAAAAGGALASTGSPSRADISALFRAGKPLRPRRACSAAMVDLLHFLPSATHLATSSLMLPAVAAGAVAEGGAAAGGGAAEAVGVGAAAGGVLGGAADAPAPPTSHGIG